MINYSKYGVWLLPLISISGVGLGLFPEILWKWCAFWFAVIILLFCYDGLSRARIKKTKPTPAPIQSVEPDYTKINEWAHGKAHKWPGETPGIYAFGRNARHEKKHNIFELLDDLCYPRIVSWSKEDDRSVGSRMFTYLINIEWPNSEPVELKWHCFEKEFDTVAIDTLLTKLKDPKTLRIGMIINSARKSLGLEPDTQYFIIPEDTK